MTPEEAIGILSSLSYKPGWTIQAYQVPGSVIFRTGTSEPSVTAFVRDGSVDLIPVVLTHAVHDEELAVFDRDRLLKWAFDVIVRREVHEVEEWLRVDGAPVYSPHPGREVGILGNGTSTLT